MASFICHHPSYSPTPFHSRHLCLTRLQRHRWAETTPVTFAFIPSIMLLPNAVIGCHPSPAFEWLTSRRDIKTALVIHIIRSLHYPVARWQIYLWGPRANIVVLLWYMPPIRMSYRHAAVIFCHGFKWWQAIGHQFSVWWMPAFRIAH